ncbi:hypothetical protein QJS64_05035 [Paraclostridium bifermentans]|uniref:Phage protein n=1 Tax=Paraclostridium bifermentans TaxID=1490 RepID=A0ABY8R712_PARBF|nr:hypothetical protein QJS64_05035 [Paraclostridium bifermentans]
MNDKAREERNAYLREWRKKNKDKIKKYNKRYWERKASKEKGREIYRMYEASIVVKKEVIRNKIFEMIEELNYEELLEMEKILDELGVK